MSEGEGAALSRAVVVRPLFLRRRLQAWYRCLQVIVCLPVLLALVRFWHAGFHPISDDAYTAMSGWDLFTGHWPTQGPHSTSASNTGVEVHHPGPLYYYLLAPFLLLGRGGGPLLIGAAAVALACGLGAVAVARRLGGVGMATAVVAAWVLAATQLGDELFVRPFNPYPPVLVLPLVLLSTWGLLREYYGLLPVWVAALALSVQCHLGNLPLAVVLVALLAVVGGVHWWRRRGVCWPLRGWRRPDAPSHVGSFLAAGAVGLLLWLPSVVELFTRHPNNLSQLVRYLQADPLRPGVGLGKSLPLVLDHAAGWEGARERGMNLLYGHSVSAISPGVLLGGLAMIAVVALPWLGRAGDRVRADSLLMWAGLLDGALVVSAVGLARIEAAGMIDWEYVQLPMIWALLWGTLGLEAWWLVRILAASAPGRFGWWSVDLRRHQVPVLVAAAAALLVAVPFAPFDSNRFLLATGRSVHAALPDVERAVRAQGGSGAAVRLDGDTFASSYDVGWGLSYGLLRDGYRVHIPTFGQLPEYWDYRKYTTAPPDAVRVYIGEAGHVAEVPAGTDPVSSVVVDRTRLSVYVLPPR